MIKQNTPEWLELRKSKIGASDCPIIMGISPWSTPYQLWEEKLGMRDKGPMNFAMKRGHDLESAALKMYNDYMGTNSKPEVVFHKDIPYMMASLDGLSEDRQVIVEIKCPGLPDHEIAGEGKIPEKYYPQLQHQLATIGLNKLHYFSYRNGEFHLVEVERDDKFIKKMYKAEEAFWNNMKSFTPPEMCDRDYVQKEDLQWKQEAEKFSNVIEEIKALKAKEKQCRDALIEMAQGKNCIGHGLKLQKIMRKGAVDYSCIPELKGVDLDSFRKKTIESWRFN